MDKFQSRCIRKKEEIAGPLKDIDSSRSSREIAPYTETLESKEKSLERIEKKIFSAPPGVKRYNVKWSNVRRNSSGQRFIFVWPQETRSRANCFIYFVPLLRRMLIGLVYLGSVHLWPGEFLPTKIPTVAPLPKPPVKCNVIEPLWDEHDKIVTKKC